MSSPRSSNANKRVAVAMRFLVLVAILGATFWLGAKALRDAPDAAAAEGGAPADMGGMPPASVFVSEVVEEKAREYRRVTGNLRAVARAQVAAVEAGAIKEILVDEGDKVIADQPLVILDRRRIDAEIAEAKSASTAAQMLITQRQAESKRAETDFKMKTGLFQKRAVSQREVLDSEREKAVAEAQVKAATDQLNAAKSRLALLKVREADLVIKAPFEGRVVERHIEPGEWLSSGGAVISLVASGEIEAWLDVPERYATLISEDPAAYRIFAEDRNLVSVAKKVKRIAEVDMRSRLFQVVATLDDNDGKLFHGMSVSADLPLGDEELLQAVPVNAVIASHLGEMVYRVKAPAGDGAMPSGERVPVQVLFRRNGKAYLAKSDLLKAGDKVVTEGNERLMPGQPVIVSQHPDEAKEKGNTLP